MKIHLLIMAAMIVAPTWCEQQLELTPLLVRLNNPHIVRRARDLNRHMHKRALMRKGVLVIGGAIVAYQAYEVVGYFLGATKQAATAIVAAAPDADVPKPGWGEWLGDKVKALGSKETWKNVGMGISYCLGNIILAKGVDRVQCAVLESESIGWFAQEHTEYLSAVQHAAAYAQELERSMAEPEKLTYYTQAFVASCDTLLEATQDLCAYMHLRIKKIDASKVQHAKSIKAFLIQEANEFAENIEHMLANGHLDRLAYHVAMFDTKLDRELSRFASIEGSVWIGVMQLKQMLRYAQNGGMW